MSAALRTMRKYGMNIASGSQDKKCISAVNADPKMPRKRLRRYLSQYGLRGEALHTEVTRIVEGPDRVTAPLEMGNYTLWPYGWQSADLTRKMRRIFKGKSKRVCIMFDEASWLFKGQGRCDHVTEKYQR
ncbi:hypothetical protein AB6D34_18405 [Pectobacterium brasiliense]|uniref:hypothetical protein n=1 Tax=Pectobacterium TaxID=122277 RepID=UPI001E3D9D07|nr:MULTISPECIES: hypothetical protein [Pectobacterium]UKY59858.1 hypothetical protein MBA20_16585 [Pectobacterium brasiliense]